MKKAATAGFTLIEMMIVTEIIAILAAIGVPAYLRQRVETNEAATVANLKVIIQAQLSHSAFKSGYGTFADLTSEDLGQGTAWLDPTWAEGGVKSGYRYSMEDATIDTFLVTAVPLKPGRTGVNTWHADEGGRIWWEERTSTPT